MSKCTVCTDFTTVRMMIFIRLLVFVPVENGIEPAAAPQIPADKRYSYLRVTDIRE